MPNLAATSAVQYHNNNVETEDTFEVQKMKAADIVYAHVPFIVFHINVDVRGSIHCQSDMYMHRRTLHE